MTLLPDVITMLMSIIAERMGVENIIMDATINFGFFLRDQADIS